MKRTIAAASCAAILGVVFGSSAFADSPTTNPDGSTTTVTHNTTAGPDGNITTTKTSTVYRCTDGRQLVRTITVTESPTEESTTTTQEYVNCGTQATPESTLRTASIAASGSSAYYGSKYGPEVWFDVDGEGNGPEPTGNANILVDGRVVGTVGLNSEGVADVTLPADTPAGKHTVDIHYLGDVNTRPAKMSESTGPMGGALVIPIYKADTHTTVTAPHKVRRSKHAKVTVKVAAEDALVAPTGRVAIYVGTRRVRTATLQASGHGKVTVSLPKMGKGSRHIKAVYLADRNHTDSKSAAKTVKVKK